MWLSKWWPTAAMITAILYLTLAPRVPHPDGLDMLQGIDKVVHALMMGTLTAVAAFDRHRAGLPASLKAVAALALWVMAFGVTTEILQDTITDARTADIADILADWTGTIAAATAYLAICRRYESKMPENR